jgi:hypothetical protein
MSEEHDGAPAPAYDDLLETALDKLDVYQARRADMDKHLKTVNEPSSAHPDCVLTRSACDVSIYLASATSTGLLQSCAGEASPRAIESQPSLVQAWAN